MKKFTKRFLTFLLMVSMVFTPCFNAFADPATAGSQASESVLDMAEAMPADLVREDKVLSTDKVSGISSDVIDVATKADLADWGFDVADVKTAQVMQDVVNNTGETYTKYIVDNDHYICVDENKEIQSIFNSGEDILAPTWDETFNTTESQYLATGEQVKEMLGLDSSYQLVRSEEETVDFWFLAYRKVESNGVINENDGVNITVARKDASVAFLNTFDMPANVLSAEITETEAQTAAQPIMEQLGYETADIDSNELTYVRPNYYWTEGGAYEEADFVRLVYEISLDNGAYLIHVDAVTGEVIGGDMAMGSGGVFGDGHLTDVMARIDAAKNKIGNTMGYVPIFWRCSSSNTTKSDILSFLQRSDARAFYFTGHGAFNSSGYAFFQVKNLLGDEVWSIFLKDLRSYNLNCNFVFLSCCNLGTASCASVFNIYSSSDNKVYMGFSDSIKIIADSNFNEIFWEKVGSNSLYNCAISAKNQLSNLYIPLYFTGDKTYKGGVLG